MKTYKLLVALMIISAFACNSTSPETSDSVLGDTIQTDSGLQYYYLKRGEGRKVEPGAEVGTYLSLMVNDSVIWTSANDSDSLFTYIADFTSVIKGFSEMTMLMQEGDNVVAILPDSLAYGTRGAGDLIPPNTTLVYNEFKMVRVDEPKGILSDTLFALYDQVGLEGIIEKYHTIVSSSDSSNYHKEISQLYDLWRTFSQEEMHQQAADLAVHFARITGDSRLRYNMVLSYENLGNIEEALDSLALIIQDNEGWEQLKEKRAELEDKLSIK